MVARKLNPKKLHQVFLFGYKQRLALFLEGLCSNPYRIRTYRGTRFLENRQS